MRGGGICIHWNEVVHWGSSARIDTSYGRCVRYGFERCAAAPLGARYGEVCTGLTFTDAFLLCELARMVIFEPFCSLRIDSADVYVQLWSI
jgi:hypothetical protein